MPKYYLRSTNANVEILCLYLNHTRCLQMQNIKKKWYKNHKEQRAEYNMRPEYQTSNKKSAHKHYWSKKAVKFPPEPPSTDLCQKIVSDFSADTAPEVFEEAGCAVCGKLTPVCKMEELSGVENLSLLRVDGVTRKARFNSSDP